MNILFYASPFFYQEDPCYLFPWVDGFYKNIISTLKKSYKSQDLKLCVSYNDSLDYCYNFQKNFGKNVLKKTFSWQEIKPPCGESTENILIKLYKEELSQEQEDFYINLIKQKFLDFIPDIIITYEPGNILKKAFPNALILNLEYGMFSRKPFPYAYKFDPYGVVGKHFLNAFAENLRNFEITQNQRKLINNLKEKIDNLINEKSPYKKVIERLEKRFDNLILLPLSVSNSYNFKGHVNYSDCVEFAVDVLDKTPKNIGVIVTTYPYGGFEFNDNTLDYLRRKYSNFIYDNNTNMYLSPSQYFLPHIDAVIVIDTSVGFQALLWDKKIISLGGGSCDFIADSKTLDNIESCIKSPKVNKDNILYWLLTRYTILNSYFENPDFLMSYLENSLNKFRKASINFDFFDPIDKDENIFNELEKSFDKNIPQIHPHHFANYYSKKIIKIIRALHNLLIRLQSTKTT
ncbi:MAG: capsule polysaccharide biosynthesis protein [uncultured bacterium]|nr:MAG: capsule polysaccharide biosynthesis protein [uncultured bacterium]